MNDNKLMNRAADNIRILAASMVEKANSGHPGGAMGGADFVNVLFSEFLVYDPENPAWEGRDRFFLDPGHMSPMLYSTLALTGKFTLDELKKAFEISGISKAPAIFDDQKLRAINGAYVHKMDPADFEKAAEPYIRQTVKRTDIDLSLLCSVLQNRTEVFSDIPEQVDFIDTMPEYDLEMYRHKKMKTTPETALEALKEALPVLESVEQWDTEHIHEALFAKIADLGVKNGWMLWPLRTAVSGKQFTPGGGVELCAILGKEDTLARVRKAIDALSA